MISSNITPNFSNLTMNLSDYPYFLSSFIDKMKFAAKIGAILIVIYILYLIIKFVLGRIREKRIKETYKNTKEILKKLEEIEKKLDMTLKKEKGRKKKKSK